MLSILSTIRNIQRKIYKKNTCVLYFHQGWTDIINCLALVTYFSERYDLVYLIIRKDAFELINFYLKSYSNIIALHEEHKILDTIGVHHLIKNLQFDSFEFIGGHDMRRLITDVFFNAYNKFTSENVVTFERAFYEAYNIPYMTRVEKFNVTRDLSQEELKYNSIVKSDNYICIHTNKYLNLTVNPDERYKEIIELDKSSNIFFDMIKVLENAKEIHVIDSVWAAICYLLDVRYNLFNHIPIYVYCHRNFSRMFTEPIHLQNWNIISFN